MTRSEPGGFSLTAPWTGAASLPGRKENSHEHCTPSLHLPDPSHAWQTLHMRSSERMMALQDASA